jgi:hypothetical protein
MKEGVRVRVRVQKERKKSQSQARPFGAMCMEALDPLMDISELPPAAYRMNDS